MILNRKTLIKMLVENIGSVGFNCGPAHRVVRGLEEKNLRLPDLGMGSDIGDNFRPRPDFIKGVR